MKIKRIHIIAVVCLTAALGSAFAVWNFYVKERLAVLAEREAREKALKDKLDELETTFFETDPSVIITAWERAKQPLEDAVRKRSTPLNLGETLLEVKLPEGVVPRFHYNDRYPEKYEALADLAWKEKCTFVVNFGVSDAQSYEGQNPTSEEIEDNLVRIEFYSSVARLLIDKGATSIQTIAVWPVRHDKKKLRSGQVEYRTTGLNFTMKMESFVKFLDFLREESRFYTVDSFWIHNKTLKDPTADVQIQMVLSQSLFVPRNLQGGGVATGSSPQINLTKAFAAGGFGTRTYEDMKRPSGFFGKLRSLIPFI